ncbi:MAG: winged helix-turn-helix domain-containing protein, partial [Nocardioidaceae bacterium]
SYTARLGAQKLDLTFKEFELVRHLAQHPGRVFTREQLLQEVWGHDYFGGTRTVDVHVRRLRAKLGPEHEALIGTVRNVGYRFVVPTPANSSPDGPHGGRPSDGPHGGRTSDRPTDPTSDPTSDRTSERAAHQ